MKFNFSDFFWINPRPHRAFFISLLVVAFPTLALNPSSKLFEQGFESVNAIQQAGGVCTLAGVACTSSVLVAGGSGNAIEFKSSGYPLMAFPVSNNGSAYINKLKGTIVLNYQPIGSPGGDWGSASPAPKIFFHLRDPNVAISRDQTLLLGTYFDGTKNYLYFRYDATNNCGSSCQREVGTYNAEPGVIMQWQPNTPHKIMATWDFTATHPFMAVFVDGNFAYSDFLFADLTGFNPTTFYVGSLNGSYPAQGRIDNLAIYSDVALDPNNPVSAYIEQTHNDGFWNPHETVNDSTDAPSPLNISGQPFIFFPSYSFEPVYEGTVPSSTLDPTEIVIDVAKNQRETAFFNIYAGTTDLNAVTTTVSNLTSGANSLDQSKIKIRTVKNWWQAGKQVMKEFIPAYAPELLLYDDTHTPQCTGSAPHPCAGGQFPSDPATAYTQTNVKAHTSRQFAITLDIPANQAPGIYTGTITVTTASLGYKTLPVKVVVHNFSLPTIDKIVALYNHSRFDIANTNDMYVTQSQYQLQLQNMREHGVNGVLYYGGTSTYPNVAAAAGLTSFGGYLNYDAAPSGFVGWLNQYSFTPYVYGEDEPQNNRPALGRNLIPDHLQRSQSIHDAQGKVVVAISKQWADNLNNPAFFPHTELGQTYTYAQGKLDLPNLAVEVDDTLTQNYFATLLSGNHTVKAANPEVYYWQMDREDPRINRFYAGYHLWLTDLAGVFPYVYQKLINDPFNDFDQASSNGERDLNVVYPSLQGGIDTIEWEAFRAGLDDYRMLQLWKTLYNQVSLQPHNNAVARKATIDALLMKYRSTGGFKLAREAFANDRSTLFAELDGMSADLVDGDSDGVGNGFDNCSTVANPTQTDVNNNGVGDVCEHGLTAQYFNNKTLSGAAVLTRIDANVDFNWGLASPGSGVNTDNFSTRWTGRLIVPAYTGTYEFCVKGDDGIRLWVNNTEILDFWVLQDSVKSCADISLTAGQSVPIQVEFFDALEEAIVQMTWSYPGQTEVVIPSSRLYAK